MSYRAAPLISFLPLPVSGQVDWHSDSVRGARRETGLCWWKPAQQLLDRPHRPPGSDHMYCVGHRVRQHER